MVSDSDFCRRMSIKLGMVVLLQITAVQSLSIDCHPDFNATEERCLQRGCRWVPKITPRAPWCEFDHADDPSRMAGYDARKQSKTSTEDNRDVFVAKLYRRSTPSIFGGDFVKATATIEMLTMDIVHVHVVDQHQRTRSALYPRWRRNLKKAREDPGGRARSEDPLVQVTVEKSPFGFGVIRKATGVKLVDTRRIPGFAFAEQYTQWSMRVPTQYVYGLGESTHPNLKHDFQYRKWGLFTRDHAIGDPEMNLFGKVC